jgi:heme exporter protein C
VDVPIVYLSSYWWRTLHPQPVVGPLAQQQPSDASIVGLLLLGVLAFTVLYAYLVRVRMHIDEAETAVAARGELAHAGA